MVYGCIWSHSVCNSLVNSRVQCTILDYKNNNHHQFVFLRCYTTGKLLVYCNQSSSSAPLFSTLATHYRIFCLHVIIFHKALMLLMDGLLSYKDQCHIWAAEEHHMLLLSLRTINNNPQSPYVAQGCNRLVSHHAKWHQVPNLILYNVVCYCSPRHGCDKDIP